MLCLAGSDAARASQMRLRHFGTLAFQGAPSFLPLHVAQTQPFASNKQRVQKHRYGSRSEAPWPWPAPSPWVCWL